MWNFLLAEVETPKEKKKKKKRKMQDEDDETEPAAETSVADSTLDTSELGKLLVTLQLTKWLQKPMMRSGFIFTFNLTFI